MEQTRDLTSLKMTELVGILKAHEARLAAREESTSEGAFNAHTKGRKFGFKGDNTDSHENQGKKWCEFCKGSNHTTNECWRKPKENDHGNNQRGNKECYNCGKIGHYANRCPSKRKGGAHVSLEDEDLDEDHMLFSASEEATTTFGEDIWLVDSGCTNHMTKEERYFSKIDKSIKVPIKLGNGELVMTAGKGDITVMISNGKKVIKNVFLVPGLEKNLLSIPQIVSRGYEVRFKDKKCIILDANGKKIMEIPMTEKSFIIKLSSVQGKAEGDVEGIHARYETGAGYTDNRKRRGGDSRTGCQSDMMVIKRRHQEKKEDAYLREEGSRRRLQRTTQENVKEIHAKHKTGTDSAVPKKRQHSGEENLPVKRKKKSTLALEECLHEGETKPNENDLRSLIVNAKRKIEEKRQYKEIDHGDSDIKTKRKNARIALNKVVASVSFDDHLKYHSELEQLGYTFIHDQVECMKMFNLFSRDDFNDEAKYTVLEKKKPPWSDELQRERRPHPDIKWNKI